MFKFHVSLGVRSSWKIRWNGESNVFFIYGWDRPDQAQRFWAWPVSLCVTNVSAIATHQAFKHPPLFGRWHGLGKDHYNNCIAAWLQTVKGAVNLTSRWQNNQRQVIHVDEFHCFDFFWCRWICVWEMCMCIDTIRYTSISSEIQILTLGISLSMFFLGG